jgi:hypothetical protein
MQNAQAPRQKMKKTTANFTKLIAMDASFELATIQLTI